MIALREDRARTGRWPWPGPTETSPPQTLAPQTLVGVASRHASHANGVSVDGELTDRLADRLRHVEPFRQLDDATRQAIAAQLDVVHVAAGSRLIRQGDAAELVYILLRGRLRVEVETVGREQHVLAELGSGSVVGEMAVVAGGPRSATVWATEDVELGALSLSAVQRLIDAFPDVGTVLSGLVSQRLRQTRLARQLRALFDRLDEKSLAAVEERVEWVSLAAGEELFHQGDEGNAAYLVVSGRLRAAVLGPDGDESVIGEVTGGELVGELSLLTGDPRSATVYAARDTEMARVPRQLFEELALRHPQGMLEVTRTVIRRQREPLIARRRVPDQLSIMVVSVSAEVASFAQTLADALAAHGSVAVLSSERVDTDLGEPEVAQAARGSAGGIRLLQRLLEVEEGHRFVVYVADAETSSWTSWCRHQADVVVSVAAATADPRPCALERVILDAAAHGRYPRLLHVLLHAPTTRYPRGTNRWLAERPGVEAVHHIRRGHHRDLARLSRILAGEAVGLVLSGGGARAFAHLGVLDALDDVGIPVDFIGGTSMGSIMALVEAMEIPRAERIAQARRATERLLDYTLPFAALVSARRVSAMLHEVSEGLDVEDLWLPYFCVSTNLTTARPVVHRRGPIAHAVRSSISIPGVMPPVPVNGHLLIDGGLLDNLPVTPMRAINPTGPIIAADVLPPVGPSAKGDWGLHLSGWRVLAGRLPWRQAVKVPTITNTILRSTIVASNQQRDTVVRDRLADCYLDLDVRGLALLDFDNLATTARRGYDGSLDRLRTWWEASGQTT